MVDHAGRLGQGQPEIRIQFRWIVVSWLLLLVLQSWDSRDGRGAAGVAEFLSTVLGMTGVVLLGLAYGLQRTMEEVAARRRRDRNTAALQQVLIALPALGFAAGAMLSGATLLMMIVMGILTPAIAIAAPIGQGFRIAALIVGALTLVWARMIAPISLNALHLGLFVPAMYILFVCDVSSAVASKTEA